jgi:hypothetical protein
MVSKLWAIGITFSEEIIPCEGLNPKIPQYAAGTRTLPPVSVPILKRKDEISTNYTSVKFKERIGNSFI